LRKEEVGLREDMEFDDAETESKWFSFESWSCSSKVSYGRRIWESGNFGPKNIHYDIQRSQQSSHAICQGTFHLFQNGAWF
jgi:hypothetical protein